MKHLVIGCLLALALIGCGGGGTATETAAEAPGTPAAGTTAAAAPGSSQGCTASGLDAMTALADFQLKMDDAQKAGKLTVDQLTAARDKLFSQTQEAQKNEDWAAYCKAIEDMRTELNL